MSDEPGPTTPPWPSHGTTAPNSMWQPTVAGPTQGGWVNVPTHRPLEPDDPRVISGYLLRARLGESGMGRVYLSYTPGGRPVAIKVIRSEFADDPAAPAPRTPVGPAPARAPRRGSRALVVAAVVVVPLAAGAITAVATGVFDKKTAGTAAGPTSTTEPAPTTTTADETPPPTDPSTPAPSTPSTSGAPGTSVPKVGSGPGSVVGQFDAIDIAAGYGIKFDQPTKPVQYTGNLYYDEYPGLEASGAR